MSELDDFLKLPEIDNITEVIKVGDRFGELTIKALTMDEFSELQKRCQKGKITNKGVDIDTNLLNLLIVSNQIIKPDFSNKEFLDKVGCTTATEFIKSRFLVGEISEISRRIQTLSGFDIDINEEIKEAKN